MQKGLLIFKNSYKNKEIKKIINFSSFDFVITDDIKLSGNNIKHLNGITRKQNFSIIKCDKPIYYSVNDIEKFILNPLYEILEVIKQENITELHLYKGGGLITLPTVVSEHIESSRNIFASKYDYFNPLIYMVLNKNIEIKWLKKRNSLLEIIRFLSRSLILFLLSLVEIIINRSKLISNNKTIIVYRKGKQKDFCKENFANAVVYKKTINPIKIFYLLRKINFKDVELKIDDAIYKVNGIIANFEYLFLLDSLYRKLLLSECKKQNLLTFETSSRFALIDSSSKMNVTSYQLTDFPHFHLLTTLDFVKFIVKNNASYEYLLKCKFKGEIKKINSNNNAKIKKENIILFCSQPYQQEVLENVCIKLLSQKKLERYKFILRKHPRDTHRYKKLENKIVFDKNIDSNFYLSKAIYIIGFSSTMLVDAKDYDTKAISLLFDEYTKVYNESAQNKDIIGVNNIDDLIEQIK